MRRRLSLLLTALCVIGYTVVGIRWIVTALHDSAGPDWFLAVCGVFWLAGGAVWAVRAVREFRKQTEETTDETDHV